MVRTVMSSACGEPWPKARAVSAMKDAAWELMAYAGATGAVVHLDGKTRSVGVTPPA